jgi:lysophospholipid acyltransferase (LPLAT)-like uncharacterized protein
VKLPGLVFAAAPVLGAAALRLLGRTLRIQREEAAAAPLWARNAPAIYVVWHGRILLLPYIYAGRKGQVLISRSRDGDLVARFIARFGIQAVRGSSSRGGAHALRALARLLADGWNVLVIPDGPRGPRERLKPGVVALARFSGCPIVPLAVGASRGWRLRSWDALLIPAPFARCVVRFGKPIDVAAAGPEEDEAARREVEEALRAVTAQADQEARA